jgi:hypothetical protein
MAGFNGRAKAGAAVALVALAIGGAAWLGATQDPAPAAVAASGAAGSASPTAAASAAAGNAARPGGKQHGAAPKSLDKPLWKELTPVQQQALEPLHAEWDKLDSIRKKKWLDIANRYSAMKPDEQARVTERMREWVRMTPEERRQVRQNFARAQKIGPTQKSAQWEEYQQLPEEQKKELAAKAAVKKQVANLPTPAQSKIKTVEPIKRPLPVDGVIPATGGAGSAASNAGAPGAAAAAGQAGVPAAGTAAANAASLPGASNVTPVPPAAPSNVK